MVTTLALAAGLLVRNLAAKHAAVVPAMYLVAVLPNLVCLFFLYQRPRSARRAPEALAAS
jgi:hypothetical protein